MVPLLRFYFHEEVRQAAVQSLPELLRSANLAAEKGLHGATKANVKQMLDFFWPQLLDAMAKVPLPHPLLPSTRLVPAFQRLTRGRWLVHSHVFRLGLLGLSPHAGSPQPIDASL